MILPYLPFFYEINVIGVIQFLTNFYVGAIKFTMELFIVSLDVALCEIRVTVPNQR